MNGFKISLLLIILVININLFSCYQDRTPLKPDDNYTWVSDTTLIPEILSAVDSNRIWENLVHLTSYPDRANYSRNIEQSAEWLSSYMSDLGFDVEYHQFLWRYFKMFFSNPDHGVFRHETDSYRTMITKDGGESFQHVDFPEGEIFFINEQTGFLTQHNKYVMYTNDGGQSWETRNETFGGWHIYFLNENKGWIDDDNMLYVTDNGGYDWQAYQPTYHNTRNFFVLDSYKIWVAGSNKLLITTDGGINWDEIPFDEFADPDNDIYFFNENEGIIRFNQHFLRYTADGGYSWHMPAGLPDRNIIRIFGFSYSYLWAVDLDNIFFSSDGGKSWQSIIQSKMAPQYLTFTDSINGWNSSGWGLYKTKNGGIEWDYKINNIPLEVSFENIVCTLPGKIYPEKELLLIGHYDTVLGSVGADDNGSGLCALLEIANILSKYDFAYTIKIIFFSMEELGKVGSQHYAAEAKDRGDDIIAVLNFDAIGYWMEGLPMDLNIEYNETSEWLADEVESIATRYTSVEVNKGMQLWSTPSDHGSFWDKGYSAVWFFEAGDNNEYNPYMNTSEDKIEFVNPSFLLGNIKVGIVSAAALAIPVKKIIK